jgi:hypothetical protein
MTWDNVLNNIQFYTGSGQISSYVISELSSDQRTSILGYLHELYHGSARAKQVIDQVVSSQNVVLGLADPADVAWFDRPSHTVAFNLSSIDKLYYVNKNGVLVKEKPQISVIHEFIHLLGTSYVDPSEESSYLNASFSDHQGSVLPVQNIISEQMGYSVNHQASYHAAVSEFDPRYSILSARSDYTEGNEIDIARIGDFGGQQLNDDLDHSSRAVSG